ncbi:hypothetical protein Pelo_10757 [Pelomyxa schiedti]|nr:hypothetical protein Pelo_10757 [Pelomyxa schiedti]
MGNTTGPQGEPGANGTPRSGGDRGAGGRPRGPKPCRKPSVVGHEAYEGAQRRREEYFTGLSAAARAANVALATESLIVVKNFRLVRPIAHGCNGIVFEVKCIGEGHPEFFREQSYVLKVPFNYGNQNKYLVGTDRNPFENEYLISSTLPPHPNINRYFCHFTDRIPEEYYVHLPPMPKEYAYNSAEKKYHAHVWIVLEYHTETLKTLLQSLPVPTPWGIVYKYSRDVCAAIVHMFQNSIIHFDVKLDNIVLSSNKEHVVMIDLGCAGKFGGTYERDTSSIDIGNQEHIAPEILNGKAHYRQDPVHNAILKCEKQPSFELGCLLYELVMHKHPLGEYPSAYGPSGEISFSIEDFLPVILPEFPSGFSALVCELLQCDPGKRLSLLSAAERLSTLDVPDEREQLMFYKYIEPLTVVDAGLCTLKSICQLQCGSSLEQSIATLREALEVEPYFSPALLLLYYIQTLITDGKEDSTLSPTEASCGTSKGSPQNHSVTPTAAITSEEKTRLLAILAGSPTFTTTDIDFTRGIHHETTFPEVVSDILWRKHIQNVMDSDLGTLIRRASALVPPTSSSSHLLLCTLEKPVINQNASTPEPDLALTKIPEVVETSVSTARPPIVTEFVVADQSALMYLYPQVIDSRISEILHKWLSNLWLAPSDLLQQVAVLEHVSSIAHIICVWNIDIYSTSENQWQAHDRVFFPKCYNLYTCADANVEEKSLIDKDLSDWNLDIIHVANTSGVIYEWDVPEDIASSKPPHSKSVPQNRHTQKQGAESSKKKRTIYSQDPVLFNFSSEYPPIDRGKVGVSLADAWNMVKTELKEEVDTECKNFALKTNPPYWRNFSCFAVFMNPKAILVHFPIHFVTYLYKSEPYIFRINAQTGSVSGTRPYGTSLLSISGKMAKVQFVFFRNHGPFKTETNNAGCVLHLFFCTL